MKLKHSIQDLLQAALDVEEKREKDKAKATRDAAPPIQITEVGEIYDRVFFSNSSAWNRLLMNRYYLL